ncbi:hypothetical protein ES754_01015 [Psychrobacter frigidicola]|uniref:SPOR domain-containing protein n=1 Tax=Psychrobacter frigidicola TaxID=45611 RepID=A0A5C7A2I3_9GAMM|nr:hypothetical protein [Psychrobacter frigidicola]TXD97601.1 hypothetical protein ES754_01015 [Psychrobacter frigidicola]
MNKKRYAAFTSMAVAASLLSLLALSGCQSLTGYQQIDQAENAESWAGKIKPVAGEVNIACLGTYHCEITQIDQTLVIAPDSHKPVNAAMLANISGSSGLNNAKPNKGAQAQTLNKTAPVDIDMTPLLNQKSVKVVPLSASGMKGLTNYYVRVKPAKREVHLNFYPENNVGYVERFAMIHEFMQPGIYHLRAYRQKSPQATGSLLDTASPEPLCIDLLQDSSLVRRFCKQLDTEHQGEFVETRVVNKAPAKLKVNNQAKG